MSTCGRRVALHLHRLVIDNPTGVHRYAVELARALTAAAQPDECIELWTGGDLPSTPVGFDVHVWPRKSRTLHLQWVLTGRPKADRFTGSVALFHSLTPSVPLPTRAPLAVTIHDVLPLTHPQWYTRSQRWTNRVALRNAVDHAAAIIVPSEAVAQDLLEHLGLARDRVTVVPEGVTGSFVQPTDPSVARRLLSRLGVEGGRYLLAVGQVAPRKNLPRLFEALAVMASRGCRPPVLVVAGGDGPGAFDIKAWPERLGVAPYVRWAGHVPDEDAAILVQNARALVHPSLYEGFGLTPLEAMAAGTPVVASAAGSLPEVVGDCGLLLDPGRASMWADAVERVMADDEWCVDASRRGAARAARFTWAAAAAATREVYASIAP